MATKTHCPQGHPLAGENLRISERDGRQCRICRREQARRGREKFREKCRTEGWPEGKGVGRWVHSTGYVVVRMPDHPCADSDGRVYEHRLVAEAALGRVLLGDHPIHHVNGIRSDNRGCNLVVCEDSAYHHMLHRRQRALDACGNPDWHRCIYCRQYDDLKRLRKRKEFEYAHPTCRPKSRAASSP